MRKYSLVLVTIILVIITSALYLYDETHKTIQSYKEPDFDITTDSLGKIEDIIWANNFVTHRNILIILSTKVIGNNNYSYVHYLDIDTNELKEIHRVLASNTLPRKLGIDNAVFGEDIFFPSINGYTTIELDFDNEKAVFNYTTTSDPEYSQLSSMIYAGNLFYTTTNDNLVHIKKLVTPFDMFSFTNDDNSDKNEINLYRKPYAIININSLDDKVAYTRINQNKLDLYLMDFNGRPSNRLNTPEITNVLSAKYIQDKFGFIGFNKNHDTDLNVFMKRRNDDTLIVGIIPNNTDRLGSIPDLDSTTWNEDYNIVYTSYDENNNGSINISSYEAEQRTIIAQPGIYGPVRVVEKELEDIDKTLILYCVNENGTNRIKICDKSGANLRDITELLK